MTTDHTDLCKRLRHGFADENYSGKVDSIMEEAADAIVALREQVAALSKGLNAAEDALTTIAVTVQPLQFKPRHDLVGNFGLVETVKQAVTALTAKEADNAALRAQIARAIRLYPQFAECFADALLAGKEGK